ncbi:MAG TPA: transketolase C-terminal domain-containing protein, partial [Candidatus Acidoferrales bacterium]|nr:transketolase C-terminal domain-containing protein [Candidatus Acidoferrales bacterium]
NAAWFVHEPGLKVVMPSTPYDAKGLLLAAIRDPNPVLYFEHKKLYRTAKGEVPDGDYTVPIGKAETRRRGRDMTVVTYGYMTTLCLEAAEKMSKEAGVEAEVIDLRTLAPLDRETVLESVRRTSKCLIVHEDKRTLGIGGEISAIIAEEAFDDLDGPILRITGPDVPAIPFAPPLEHAWMVNTDKIVAGMQKLAAY